ncbi:MAG: DUF4145 domain-containing protein, partial [Terriglobales bacterium]
WMYHSEIRAFLQRIRKGKFLGQEIELEHELKELQQGAEKAEQAVSTSIAENPQIDVEQPLSWDTASEIFRDAAKSPKAALLLLAAQLEKRVRELLAVTGWGEGKRVRLSETIEKLRQQGSLPEHVTGTLKLFSEVRNRLVHGHEATDEDILRAIDSGVLLLRAIEAIPAETHIVHETNVPLYSNSGCTQRRKDVDGVALETTSPGGTQKRLKIVPTTKAHFKVGERVSWEWSFDNTWDQTWYKDSEKKCQSAWISSAEFVGRHLKDI